LKLLGFTAQPLTPLNRPGKENQKFKFFSKCSENSKNFKEYYSKVTDHEYLVSSAILYRYCGEIAGWAVERGERLSSEPEYHPTDVSVHQLTLQPIITAKGGP
jgi:hypothetical protein